jgi:hypothetical protein
MAGIESEEAEMSEAGERSGSVDPAEQHGGGAPMGEREINEKGPWAAKANEGIVPVEGDQDSADTDDVQELGGEVTGRTTGSEEPATEDGVDLSAGDHADATEFGGPDTPKDAEPDLKDVGAGPRQVDVDAST